GDLDAFAVRPLVGAGNGLRRGHDAADVVNVVDVIFPLVAPFEDVLLVVIVQGRTGNILVAEAIETLAVQFPDQRAAPRLGRPGILNESRIVAWQPWRHLHILRPGDKAVLLDRTLVVEREPARRFLLFRGMTGDTAPLQDRFDVAVELDIRDAPGEMNTG